MHNGRWRYWGPLSVVLVVAFALRLWGIKQGLPYVYDVDEYGHFVPEAVAMFDHGLNPHYFVNPPALTYLLHVVFGVWFGLIGLGSRSSVTREFALHPDRLFLLARITVALLGTVSVWLLYLLGARLFDRAVGLLASAVMAVAFLPVFYGHLALNDAPTLVGLTLSLLGTRRRSATGTDGGLPAGGDRPGPGHRDEVHGGRDDPAAAGRGGGAIPRRERRDRRGDRRGSDGPPRKAGRPPVRGDRHGVALTAALAAYLIANPYSLLDFHAFKAELEVQSQLHRTVAGLMDRRAAAGWLRLLPMVVHVGARLDSRAGGARRGSEHLAQSSGGSAGCSCRSPCSTCCS